MTKATSTRNLFVLMTPEGQESTVEGRHGRMVAGMKTEAEIRELKI